MHNPIDLEAAALFNRNMEKGIKATGHTRFLPHELAGMVGGRILDFGILGCSLLLSIACDIRAMRALAEKGASGAGDRQKT